MREGGGLGLKQSLSPANGPHLREEPGDSMIERQRLEMERYLGSARRSMYAALEVAQRGAYYGLEDELVDILQRSQLLMDAIIKGKEKVSK